METKKKKEPKIYPIIEEKIITVSQERLDEIKKQEVNQNIIVNFAKIEDNKPIDTLNINNKLKL